MKKLNLTLLTLITPVFIFCQIIPFQKKFGGLDREYLREVATTSDGHYVAGGVI